MANSIEDLKALMNTKLGFARPNKFLVTLPSVGVGGGLLNGLIGAFSAINSYICIYELEKSQWWTKLYQHGY